jgi:hypothetical protein
MKNSAIHRRTKKSGMIVNGLPGLKQLDEGAAVLPFSSWWTHISRTQVQMPARRYISLGAYFA